jgi:hypothetical protein
LEKLEAEIQSIIDAKLHYHFVASGEWTMQSHEYLFHDAQIGKLATLYIPTALKIGHILLQVQQLKAPDNQQIWKLSLVGEKQTVKYSFQMLDLLFHYAGKDESECCVCTLPGLVDLHPHKQIHHIIYDEREVTVKHIPREEDLKDAFAQKQKFRSHRMCTNCFKDHFFCYNRNFCPVCAEVFAREEIKSFEKFACHNNKNFSNEPKSLEKFAKPKPKAKLDSELNDE